MNAISKAIEIVGTQEALANQCNVTQAAISHFVRGLRKPKAETAIEIERATSGKVKVEEILPDIPWHIVRNSK